MPLWAHLSNHFSNVMCQISSSFWNLMLTWTILCSGASHYFLLAIYHPLCFQLLSHLLVTVSSLSQFQLFFPPIVIYFAYKCSPFYHSFPEFLCSQFHQTTCPNFFLNPEESEFITQIFTLFSSVTESTGETVFTIKEIVEKIQAELFNNFSFC